MESLDVGAVLGILGVIIGAVATFMTAKQGRRGQTETARINAGVQHRQVDLSVLSETVEVMQKSLETTQKELGTTKGEVKELQAKVNALQSKYWRAIAFIRETLLVITSNGYAAPDPHPSIRDDI